MGFGSALKHNNAGVFRHPTQRKSCSSWPFMAIAAFNSTLSDNPMAPSEMREKLARSCTRTPSGGIATSPTRDPKQRPNQRRTQAHARTHSRTRKISEWNVGSEAQFCSSLNEREFRLGPHFPVGRWGHLSRTPTGESALRWPIGQFRPSPDRDHYQNLLGEIR